MSNGLVVAKVLTLRCKQPRSSIHSAITCRPVAEWTSVYAVLQNSDVIEEHSRSRMRCEE